MEDKIGNIYEGIVSSITSFGMFVELESTIEGLIRFENMGREYFVYDEKRKTLVGERTNRVFKIGDKVILNGYIYVSSNATTPARKITNKITNITRIANGSRHPDNTTGDLGWCDESSLKLYEEDKKYECEIELIDKDSLIEYLKSHKGKIIMISQEDLERIFDL